MIIDLILDRKDGMAYSARDFYLEIVDSVVCKADANRISRAMDEGSNKDVQKALCKYIENNGYPAEIKDYINAQTWI